MKAAHPALRSHSLELLMAYHQCPSVAIRNKLVRLNSGLVRKIAHRLSQKCTEPYEDLEQIGFIGLIRAIERFNPSQGCAFSSFAVPYIRGEILHFLRDRSGMLKVPRRLQDLHKRGCQVEVTLKKQLERDPSDLEVSQALGVSMTDWQDAKTALQNRSMLSLDAHVGFQYDSQMALVDTLPDSHQQTLQRLEEDRQILHSALSQLEETTRAAIEFVFLADLPRKEAAKQIGVSPMTVSRHVHRGLDQMMTFLQPQPSS